MTNAPDPLANALTALTPAPAMLNRDRLLFEAGKAAGSRTTRIWRCAAGSASFAAMGLAIVLGLRSPTIVQSEQIVYVDREIVKPAAIVKPELPANEELVRFLKLREAVLARGVDELPPAPPGVVKPGTSAFASLRNVD